MENNQVKKRDRGKLSMTEALTPGRVVAGVALAGLVVYYGCKTLRRRLSKRQEGGCKKDNHLKNLLKAKGMLLERSRSLAVELANFDSEASGARGERRLNYLETESQRVSQEIANIDYMIQEMLQLQMRQDVTEKSKNIEAVADLLAKVE